MGQELTKQGGALIRDLLNERREDFQKALGKNIRMDLFIRSALTMIQESPKLMDCTQASLFTALLKAAQLSLSPDGLLGQSYLVPYGNKAQLIIGYKGLRELALRTGKYQDVRARIVFQNDKFDIALGTDEFVNHVPAEGDRGEMRGCYAVAVLMDGSAIAEFMWRKEIEKHRNQYSQGYKAAEKSWQGKPAKKDSPWHTATEAMWEKTLIRKLAKRLQMSPDAQQVMAREEMMEAGLTLPADDMDSIIDIPTDMREDDETKQEDTKDKTKGISGAESLLDEKNGKSTQKKLTKKAKDVLKEAEKHIKLEKENYPGQIEDLKTAIEEKIKEDSPKIYWKEAFSSICVNLFGDIALSPTQDYKYNINEINVEILDKVWETIK